MINYSDCKVGLHVTVNVTGGYDGVWEITELVHANTGNPSEATIRARKVGTTGSSTAFFVKNLEMHNPKQYLQERLAKEKQTVADTESQIAFLEATGKEEFDDLEWRAWRVLQLMKDEKMTDIQKSEVIATLIRNKK